jgi:hypothetical protein
MSCCNIISALLLLWRKYGNAEGDRAVVTGRIALDCQKIETIISFFNVFLGPFVSHHFTCI